MNADHNMEIEQLLAHRRIQCIIKRILDFILSSVAIVVLCPVFIAIAIAIHLDSDGPVFFRQERIGKRGKPFRIFKFRTMHVNADKQGPSITIGSDSRITRVGAFLRKMKLDETAQVFNVFLGEMSFVGPRPEVPKYVELYSPWQKQVLLVRPGITDYASIAYRNESEILAKADDPESLYINFIMPEKIKLNMKYLHEISPITDAKLIIKTIVVVIFR